MLKVIPIEFSPQSTSSHGPSYYKRPNGQYFCQSGWEKDYPNVMDENLARELEEELKGTVFPPPPSPSTSLFGQKPLRIETRRGRWNFRVDQGEIKVSPDQYDKYKAYYDAMLARVIDTFDGKKTSPLALHRFLSDYGIQQDGLSVALDDEDRLCVYHCQGYRDTTIPFYICRFEEL